MVILDPPVIDSHFINFNFYFPYPELFFLSNSTIARRGSLNKMVCGEKSVDRFRVRRLLTVGVFRCNCNCWTQLLSIFFVCCISAGTGFDHSRLRFARVVGSVFFSFVVVVAGFPLATGFHSHEGNGFAVRHSRQAAPGDQHSLMSPRCGDERATLLSQ